MPPYNPGTGFRRGNRRFGRQKHPITGVVTGHAGDDWPAPEGTPIPAAYDGEVKQIDHQYNAAKGTGWGWYVLLEHTVRGQTVRTRYAHMRVRSPLQVGDKVVKGQTIGEAGSTGGSTGPHLHFEVIVNGTPVDPGTFDFPDGGHASGEWAFPFQMLDPPQETEQNDNNHIGNASAPPAKPPGSAIYFESLGNAESGAYPIGANGIWHGGIHFDRGTASNLQQDKGARALTAGEVIAYRVDSAYPISRYGEGEGEFSTGFVLVRHKLQLPPSPKKDAAASETPSENRPQTQRDDAAQTPQSAAVLAPNGATSARDAMTPPTAPEQAQAQATEDPTKKEECLTFYSLYMHLAKVSEYEGKDRQRPSYWESADNKYRVASKAVDNNPYDQTDARKGINVRKGPRSSTDRIGWLPPGVAITVEAGRSAWRKIVSFDEGGIASDPSHTASQDAPRGWIYTGELDKITISNPAETDKIYILETPIRLKAGDFIGYLGQYKRRRDVGPFCSDRPMMHLEVFTGDDLPSFIERSRERAKELPEVGRTLLLIEEGAQLALPSEPDQAIATSDAVVPGVIDKEAAWVQVRKGQVQTLPRSALGTYSNDTTRIYGGKHHLLRILDAAGNEIALEQFNLLDKVGKDRYPNREVVTAGSSTPLWVERAQLGNDRVITGRELKAWSRFPLQASNTNGPKAAIPRVIAISELGKATTEPDSGIRWWKVQVGAEDGSTETGWACDKDQTKVRLCSPWDWPGFDITRESTPGKDMLEHSIEVNAETQTGEDFKGTADQVDGSPLFQRLRKIIDVDGKDGVSRQEMRLALRKPWLAQALSRLIVHYESEWGGSMSKWDALDIHMQGDLAADWTTEKQRIEKLRWWDELAGKDNFPQSPEAYHLHPIGLVNNFFNIKPSSGLAELIRRIGDIISHGEGSYESYNTGTKGVAGGRVGHSYMRPPAGTVTGKTINEIIATDGLSGTDTNRMFATGKYQTVITTLRSAKSQMGLTGEEKYDAEMQERVFAEYLLEKAGGGALARFVKEGKGTIDDAQYAAAKEWASIAAPNGKSISNGQTSDGSLSYYESAANHANTTSSRNLRAILQEIQSSR